MSRRILLTVLALLVVVAALVTGAVRLLSVDESGVGGPGTPPDGGQAAEEPGPKTTPVPPREHTQIQHELPWPFAEFTEDIAELRRPRRRDVFMLRDRIEDELGRELSEPRVTLRLENVTPEQVIAELTREFAQHGLKVYTRDPPVDNDPVFERFYHSDASVWEIIQSMRVRTGDLVTYAITPEGLCIGSRKACIDARADATLWEKEQVGEGDPDDAFAFLEGNYRADFTDAHIGAVLRDVKEQTGVEVIVDPELWGKPVKLTWRADPMSVLAALRQIAIKCGGALYAKDDRVFLLDR